jgi:CheY-like chemotaxis protein
VASTILAVDDSATMRKILEITFAGTDFQLVTAQSGDEAVAKLRAGGVSLVICDNSLEPSDGYDVAGQLKSAAPSVPVLFLSSRQNPYDAGKGSGARVDDHMDKPFDTQQLIDRVSKLLGGAGASAGAPAAAAAPAAPAPAAAPVRAKTQAYGGMPAPAPAPAAAPKAAGFGAGGLGGPKPAAAPAARPAPAAAAPAPAPAPAARPAAAAVSTAATAASAQMAGKLGEMGLTPAQADAVLALSRDVIERIVWEVVPVLAETLIKEEIARLTK